MWGVCGAAEIHQLQKLQNRAARIITGSNYDAPSKPLIESLGWKTINDMIQFESRVMVFNSLNRLTPQYLSDLLCGSLHQSLIQPKKHLHGSYAAKEEHLDWPEKLLFMVAELWNGLPDPSKRASSLISFRSFL